MKAFPSRTRLTYIDYAAFGLPIAVVKAATALGKRLADLTIEALRRGLGAFASPWDIFNSIVGWGNL